MSGDRGRSPAGQKHTIKANDADLSLAPRAAVERRSERSRSRTEEKGQLQITSGSLSANPPSVTIGNSRGPSSTVLDDAVCDNSNADDELANRGQTGPEDGRVVHDVLPPTDGGKDAYLVLAAAFILEGLVWGFPFAFGVFQEYYVQDSRFEHNEAGIAAIGTTATGIMFLAAPLMYAIFRPFPRWRKLVSILGFCIVTAALIAASFANDLNQLIATQGVMYAIGGLMNYYPVFQYLDEWWIRRKGFAYGVVWAGGCTSGVAIPLVMRWLLATYGFRTALRVWAVTSFVLSAPTLFWLKSRIPEHLQNNGERRRVDWGFLRSPAFWVLQTGNICQCLGYYMPSLYLPSFAQSVGAGTVAGTVALSLMNAANIIGATVAGIMTDKFHVTTAINVCCAGTLVAIFVFWSFAVYTPMLFIFAIMYGAFAGGFASTWAGVADPVRKQYPTMDTGMVVSMFLAGKGIASIVSGPLSGVLVRSDAWKGSAALGFGSGYGYMIVFSGVSAALSLIGWCGKKCGLVG